MSYDDTDLTTPLNTTRALLGDTSNDSATERFTDDHIDAALLVYGYNGGVAFLAEETAAWYALKITSVGLPGGLSAAYAQRVIFFKELAERMRGGGVSGTYTAFSRTPTRVDGYSALQAEVDAA